MIDRSFSSSKYRFGFNGQEKNDEVNGENKNIEFKYRVYDSRLGRFLSTDPLGKQFAWNSTYSFAMNRVIDGIELEGLEYLSSEEARIKVVGGESHVNLQNFNSVTRSLWEKRNNEQSPPCHCIGWPTKVGEISHPELPPTAESASLDNTHGATDPAYNPTIIRKQGIKANGGIDKRVKAPIAGPNTSRMVRGAAGLAIALNTVNWALETYGNSLVVEDQDLVREHSGLLKNQVLKDLQVALESGMIPKEYQNVEAMGNIANVVLSGTNLTKDQKIYDIGIEIVKKVSHNFRAPLIIINSDNHSSGSNPADNTAVKKTIVTTEVEEQ